MRQHAIFWGIRLAAAALCAAIYAVSADAQVLPNLPAGTQYQIIFASSGTMSGTDSVEADYNSFITTQANQSAVLAALNVQWSALVSTTSTSVTSNAPSLGLPIYNTAGIEVSAGNIYSGSLLAPIDDRNVNVWTGFATGAIVIGVPEELGLGDIVDDPLNPGHHNPYGSFYYPTFGHSGAMDSTWSGYASGILDEFSSLAIYGISSPITAGNVPEPATWLLIAIGLLCTAPMITVDRSKKREWAQKRLQRLVAVWWPRGSIIAFIIGLLFPPNVHGDLRSIDLWGLRCIQGFTVFVVWTVLCVLEWFYLKMLIGSHRTS